jgi:2-amino-4-hydroxy-6-hydroxymethyldihydropteridine diphosphokinase/dihydropteroate synthase
MREWINPRSKQPLKKMFAQIVEPGLMDKDSSQMTEPMHVVTPLTTGAMRHPLDPFRKTLVMSILNTTPDSFSDGGSNALDPQSLRKTAAAHIAAGATIIDVGGQSSRPNAPDVTVEEEINRVLPAIAAIKSLPEAEGIAISVDTYRAAVAEAAVNAGAHIVNDISAGMLDPHMFSTVARLGCTYIMMHMRGTPATMQSPENCTYHNLRTEITNELYSRVALAVEAGVRKWRIVLDPGIGFAKTQDQNIDLLRAPLLPARNPPRTSTQLSRYKKHVKTLLRMPQLIGCSRKRFIGNITGVVEPKDRIFGTAAAVTASIRGGADIVRVHDVQEMVHVAKMADAMYRHKNNIY